MKISSVSVMLETVKNSQKMTAHGNDARQHDGQAGEKIGPPAGQKVFVHAASLGLRRSLLK